jgi:hypothetical protein
MITGLQVFALFAALILSYFSFLSFKRHEFTLREYLGWQTVWGIFGVVTLFPAQFAVWSTKFGSIRPLDFFTVSGFIVVLSISFYTYVNVDRLRKKLEKAIRDLALKDLD